MVFGSWFLVFAFSVFWFLATKVSGLLVFGFWFFGFWFLVFWFLVFGYFYLIGIFGFLVFWPKTKNQKPVFLFWFLVFWFLAVSDLGNHPKNSRGAIIFIMLSTMLSTLNNYLGMLSPTLLITLKTHGAPSFS